MAKLKVFTSLVLGFSKMILETPLVFRYLVRFSRSGGGGSPTLEGGSTLGRLQSCAAGEFSTAYKLIYHKLSSICGLQEHHFSLLQRETERLRSDIDKIRSELRYEVDKVTAGHRLDLNLERGRIRDELATQSQETSNLTNKLDREIHTLKTQLEAAKYDIIKYCIGSVISVAAVGLGLLRVIM